MPSVNKVILLGHLGRDPEVKYTPNGTAVTNFSIATSRQWKDKTSGDRVEETEWHRLVAYDRLAEVVGEYLKKGRPVYIEGRLKTRKWQKDGVDHYVTEVVVESLQMLGSRDDGESKAPAQQRASAPAPRPGPSKPATQRTGFDDMDDDIPF